MNEIIIDQKKYVSSKRAAEMTGYAKDYVGQLCREGRVPARLVGRSWYVLESAIQDHRFGPTPHEAKQKEKKETEEPTSVLPPTWESPHYEAVNEDSLPHINRLRSQEEVVTPEPSEEEDHDPVARMRDSWKQWFADSSEEDTAEPVAEATELVEEVTEEVFLPEAQEEETEESESVPVAIHAIHHPELTRESLPQNPQMHVLDEREQVVSSREPVGRTARRTGSYRTLTALIYFVCFCAVIMGVAGSGFMDEIIISDSQAGFIAGIHIYNK